MTFDASVLWPALKAAGMLVEAEYQPSSGPSAPVDIGFVQPDVQLLGGMVQSSEFEIEFQTADMPALQMGETLTFGAATYKIRANPKKKGDGFFSTVTLSKQ
ncbi:hypothetical protein [Herbaspirillum sp. ST 5-3]|uniref:head-tail joining protein n=1 Tax=Oxalobacteraceae TaxID=75682 RepID=UPI0010A4C03D|nr:hypothetical protein [Herbaspirillum sp. ST 5-3]